MTDTDDTEQHEPELNPEVDAAAVVHRALAEDVKRHHELQHVEYHDDGTVTVVDFQGIVWTITPEPTADLSTFREDLQDALADAEEAVQADAEQRRQDDLEERARQDEAAAEQLAAEAAERTSAADAKATADKARAKATAKSREQAELDARAHKEEAERLAAQEAETRPDAKPGHRPWRDVLAEDASRAETEGTEPEEADEADDQGDTDGDN